MKKLNKSIFKTLCVFWFIFSVFAANSQIAINIESGLAFQTYNDVEIPNNRNATRFSLASDFSPNTALKSFFRARLELSFGTKNQLLLLYAPLSIRSSAVLESKIDFQNQEFAAGMKTDALYTFNSYRLSYRRYLILNEKWELALGLTAKIRDAEIKLSNNQLSANKTDFGFVPLVHVYAAYKTKKFKYLLDADALAGGPGRAVDAFAGVHYKFSKKIDFKLGYRILEGGANTSVYNFTLIHFLSTGFVYSF